MSYVSLARKYRPRRFVDMVGQEATTLALTNAIRLRREPHSVIFTGVRGVGKTTTARIYAKALNCEQGPTADPCDICASCMAITVGNHEDVLEIDGASNTGVDDVRALQETLSYVPQRSTYKIYIIDEVHMLSISAFNALLKTLEEPPQHVVFIFATTELHKVPETIQSRCQTFHLQKISRPVIAERIRSILHAEEIPFDEAALALVAREGRGSLRDALTMLDQAIAVGAGTVSFDTLKHVVGGSQSLPVMELLQGLLKKDAHQILGVIARWDQEGLSMSSLAEETAKACRNAFILRDLKGQSIDLQILELEDREQQTLLEFGEHAAPMDLNRLFRQLTKCLDDLRHADLDRFVLENYCLEWCFDPGLPDLQMMMHMLSGQPVAASSQPLVRPAPAQASDVPAMNLRDRWKTSAPSPGQPAPAKPAVAHVPAPTPAPGPAPTMQSSPAPMATPPPFASATSIPKVEVEKAKEPSPQVHAPAPVATSAPKTEVPPAPMAPPAQKLEQPTPPPAAQPVASPPAARTVPVAPEKQQVLQELLATQPQAPTPPAAPLVKESRFPENWRGFVDEWKKQKPLQGRVLEEAYVLEYSAQRIRLAVEPQSMAGGKLLQQEVRKRLLEQFTQLFDFHGQLEVVAKADAKPGRTGAETAANPLGETLLEVKQRERDVARESLKHRLEEHPMTREVISRFGGTIEQIDLQ